MADLPQSLKPSGPTDNNVVCLTRAEAVNAQIAILENQSCHEQLRSATQSADWIGIVLIGVGALTTGFVLGQAIHN